MIEFTIPGTPVGKGRARSTRSGRHYTPEATRAYESQVAWLATAARGAAPPITEPSSTATSASPVSA